MKNAWILIIAISSLIAIVIYVFSKHKKHAKTKSKKQSFRPLANTNLARNLPEYKSVEKKYRLLLSMLILLFLVAFGSTAFVASRPIAITTKKPTYDSRDIMLCLDISGSMSEHIEELLRYFSTLLREFKGQRVGMTVFDNSYITISPLTNDYETLFGIITEFLEKRDSYTATMWNTESGTSAIGTGVVGCVNSFGNLEEDGRSRSIILATDNFTGNDSITLTQAGNYAKRYNIAIFGLSTKDSRTAQEIEDEKNEISVFKEFREVTINTGGSYYAFSLQGDNNISISGIVDQILAQFNARVEGTETLVESDIPLIPSIIALVSVILLIIIIWRLGL